MHRSQFAERYPGELLSIGGMGIAYAPAPLPPTWDMSPRFQRLHELAILRLGELRAIFPSAAQLTTVAVHVPASRSCTFESHRGDPHQRRATDVVRDRSDQSPNRKFPCGARRQRSVQLCPSHGKWPSSAIDAASWRHRHDRRAATPNHTMARAGNARGTHGGGRERRQGPRQVPNGPSTHRVVSRHRFGPIRPAATRGGSSPRWTIWNRSSTPNHTFLHSSGLPLPTTNSRRFTPLRMATGELVVC